MTVEKTPYEEDRYAAAVEALRERYVLSEVEGPEYRAKLGDAVDADMNGFEIAPDGSAGDPLPTGIASGDNYLRTPGVGDVSSLSSLALRDN